MEEDKTKKIISRIERAIDLIESSEVEEGMNILKLCEERLELSSNIECDLKMIIFHNLALCFQLGEDYSECGNYLKQTIKVAKSRDLMLDIDKIRNMRYISMLYIQQGAIFSHLGEHDNSVQCAKNAFSYISKAYQACVLSSSASSLPESLQSNLKTLEQCLSFLSGTMTRFPTNCHKIIQRTSLGVLHFTDWIYSFTINDLLDIKPLKYFEVKNSETFASEFSKDLMLQKICLLVTSCYLIATESRLLEEENEVKKAKSWHLRAVDLGSALLPIETPLLQHVKSSFDKHYPGVTVVKPKIPKSKTPIKEKKIVSKSRTPVRSKNSSRKPGKIEVTTERNYFKEKLEQKKVLVEKKIRTQREENREPEPPISEDFDESPTNSTFVINSNDLYGIHSYDE